MKNKTLKLLSDEFIYKVVRLAQPHLDDDCAVWRNHFAECKYWLEIAHGIATPPAAQRPWVGLTDVNAVELWQLARYDIVEFARVIEAKLKELNA